MRYEVDFKLTYEGLVFVEADSVSEAVAKVRKGLETRCFVEGEEALEVKSYNHVHTVTPEHEVE